MATDGVPAVGKQVPAEQGAFRAQRKIGYLLRRLSFLFFGPPQLCPVPIFIIK